MLKLINMLCNKVPKDLVSFLILLLLQTQTVFIICKSRHLDFGWKGFWYKCINNKTNNRYAI